MNKNQKEVLSFIKKINFPCNPLHAESLSKFHEDVLKGILNRLSEDGYIVQTYHSNGGFSVKIH